MICRVEAVTPHGEGHEAYNVLRRELWPMPAEECERETQAQLAQPDRWAVFLARVEGKPAGFVEANLRDYAEGTEHSPVPYLEGWYVVPRFRRQGVGRALVEAVEQWARARGYSEIASDTTLDNSVSLAAHERLGYREVERQVCLLKSLSPRKTC